MCPMARLANIDESALVILTDSCTRPRRSGRPLHVFSLDLVVNLLHYCSNLPRKVAAKILLECI
jgi:hypothetical protein